MRDHLDIARIYAALSNRYLVERVENHPGRAMTAGALRCLANAYRETRAGKIERAHQYCEMAQACLIAGSKEKAA